jgi:hypothetical protein
MAVRDFNMKAWRKKRDGGDEKFAVRNRICVTRSLNRETCLNVIIAGCRSKGTRHLLIMKGTRIPKLVCECTWTGRRNVGWPRKGWTDRRHGERKSLEWLVRVLLSLAMESREVLLCQVKCVRVTAAWILWERSCGQPTRSGPPAWGLVEDL